MLIQEKSEIILFWRCQWAAAKPKKSKCIEKRLCAYNIVVKRFVTKAWIEREFIKVSTKKTIELNRDNFCLKASIEGSGPVAIVIGSHKYYPRTFSENLKSKLHLVCADTRGFVPASPNHTEDDFTVDKLVQDIEAMRVSLGADKMILIGHSIHAFMAMEYARAFPDRVSHLVLIASSPITGPEIYNEADRYFEESVCPERKTAFATSMQKFVESGDQSFVARLLSFGPRIWYDENFDASKLWEGVEVHSVGAGIIWGSMFADYNVANALKSIQCPTFLGTWKI
jgi:proline iminopeptidase